MTFGHFYKQVGTVGFCNLFCVCVDRTSWPYPCDWFDSPAKHLRKWHLSVIHEYLLSSGVQTSKVQWNLRLLFSSASATMCFLGAGWLYDISESRILVSQIVSNYMYVKILQNLPKIWCPSLGLPAHEGPEGPHRWPKSWSTSLMKKGWGSWACLVWRSEGSRESSLRPSRRELSCRRKTVFLCSLIVIGQGGMALN